MRFRADPSRIYSGLRSSSLSARRRLRWYLSNDRLETARIGGDLSAQRVVASRGHAGPKCLRAARPPPRPHHCLVSTWSSR